MKAKPVKTRFSLLRFSVRFLMLVIFLAACVLGWISWKIQTARAEVQLARELAEAGHEVRWSHVEYGDVEGVWPEPGWSYDWLRNHYSSHVSDLWLRDSDISQQQCEAFKKLYPKIEFDFTPKK